MAERTECPHDPPHLSIPGFASVHCKPPVEASVWLEGEDGVGYIAVRKDGKSIRMSREEADRVSRGLAAAVALDTEGEEHERLMGNG